MSYKTCSVPECTNTTVKTPEKLFVSVPKNAKMRRRWLTLARRNPDDLVVNSTIYFCEDHFDLEKDMKNYWQYKMGFSGKKVMEDGVVPSKFHCQQHRRKKMDDATSSRPKRIRLVQECEDNMQTANVEEVVISEDRRTTETAFETVCVDDIRKDVKREIQELNCCFCLRQDNLFNLLDTPASGGEYENYAAMINYCFRIEMIISNEIDFKNLYAICEFCLSRLKDAHDFRTDVQNGLNHIKSIIGNDASFSKQNKSETYRIAEINIKSENYIKEELNNVDTSTNIECSANVELNFPLRTKSKVNDKKICIIKDAYTMSSDSARRSVTKKNNSKESVQTLNRDADLSTMALSVRDQNSAIEFFQICGIIPQQKLCRRGHKMTIITEKKNTPLWVCGLTPCRAKNGIRNDTWLQHSKMPLAAVVHFIYHWSMETISAKFCTEKLGISHKSTYNEWNNILRRICAWRVDQYNSQIGGEGLRVEIYRSSINQFENNHVFVGVCIETKDIFIVPLLEASVNSLIPIILDKIKAGSEIITCDPQLYSNENVMKQYVFVKPESVDHMKDVGNVFAFIRLSYLKQTSFSDGNIAEWIWRLKLGEKNAFEEMLRDIVAFWEANHTHLM